MSKKYKYIPLFKLYIGALFIICFHVQCWSEEYYLSLEDPVMPSEYKAEKTSNEEIQDRVNHSTPEENERSQLTLLNAISNPTIEDLSHSSISLTEPLLELMDVPAVEQTSSQASCLQKKAFNRKASKRCSSFSTKKPDLQGKVTVKANAHKLKTKIIALENTGDFLSAEQEMDQYLKLVNTPTIGDLCYALDLSKKTAFVTQQSDRVQQFATLISKHLNIDPHAPKIRFCKYTWRDLRSYFDYLIAETVSNPVYEARKLKYKVIGENIGEHMQWLLAHMRSYKYPISIGGGGYGSEGKKSTDGVWDIYLEKLTIDNYTQKEKEARESYAYRFHEGKLDITRVNPMTFYNLMVRAGFEEEDFKKGKHGFQDKVLVKPILLTENTIEACHIELQEKVTSGLNKSSHPYVTFIFELQPDASFTANELYSYNSSERTRYFFYELKGPAATINDQRENRLYFCFRNTKQSILDLHTASEQEAFAKVQTFIIEKHSNLEDSCTIITGRGNHINLNGQTAILHKKFKQWARKELKPYIKSCFPIGSNGGYKVILRKPTTLILEDQPFEVHREQVITSILQVEKVGGKCLIIKSKQPQSSRYFYKLASMALDQTFGYLNGEQIKDIEDGIYISWEKP